MNTVVNNITFKKTKSDIIQRLLEEKHITVEEAMTLMTQEPSPINPYNPYPYNPLQPPFIVGDIPGTLKSNPYYKYTSTTSDGTYHVPPNHTDQK